MTAALFLPPVAAPRAAVWTFLFGDLRTGRITGELPVLSPRFEAPLNDAGTFTGTVNVDDPDVAELNPYEALAPGRTFLAIELDGELVYGGPLWSHRYSTADRALRLAGAGLWSVWDHRKVIPALALNTPAAEAADTLYRNLTLPGVARRLVAQAFAHTGGDLPVVRADGGPITADPGGETGGGHDRTYRGYELTWLGDALRELTEVDDGPDLELRPRRDPTRPGFVQWVLRAGNPYLTQAGAPWTLEAPDVVDVEVDRDGTGLAGRAWATGDGTQRLRLIKHADDTTLVDAGGPLLEAEDAHSSATEAATVQAYAVSLAALRARPVEAWTVTVRTDAELRPGTYAVGDYFTVPVEGDPYLPDGDHVARCLSIGGNGRHLTLTMEPAAGGL